MVSDSNTKKFDNLSLLEGLITNITAINEWNMHNTLGKPTGTDLQVQQRGRGVLD